MSEVERLLDLAEEDLAAASSLLHEGHARQAVSRSYYAVFYTASAALAALGELRSKHSGVISAFRRLVVKEGGLDPELGETLRELFDDRNEADYGSGSVRRREAEADVEAAKRFVAGVRDWLAAR